MNKFHPLELVSNGLSTVWSEIRSNSSILCASGRYMLTEAETWLTMVM